MKEGLSEIICIIDRSGSMMSIVDDAIGGFNQFLKEQKEVPGEANLTYIQFNHEHDVVLENKEINNVEEIDTKTYIPCGTTALYDAIGKTINSIGNRLDNLDEDKKPENVIIAILTDGQENDSKEFTDPKTIKKMIEHQKEKYNWNFIFLAANQDAFLTSSMLGVSKDDTYNFKATGKGIKDAYRSMSSSVTTYRS